MGRPRKPINQKKRNQLTIWVTDDEYGTIIKATEIRNINVTDLLREGMLAFLDKHQTRVGKNYTGIGGNHNKWTCPQCHGPLDVADIQTVEGMIGAELVISYTVHLECLTCPQILNIAVSVGELDVEWERKV